MEKFTYDEYSGLIDLLLEKDYTPIFYKESGKYRKEVILRHDVDSSLEKALELAKFENELGVKSTYYILMTSKLYNVLNNESKTIIKQILSFGHEIGLHFDETQYEGLWCENGYEDIRNKIIKERDLFIKIFDDKINIDSVSMHIPLRKTLEADVTFGDGFINSYGKKFFKGYKYISDSKMIWREDVKKIIKSMEYDKLHILTHPQWYDKAYITKKEKMINLLKKKKKNIFEEVPINNRIDINIEDF